jgi:hypothetical protein
MTNQIQLQNSTESLLSQMRFVTSNSREIITTAAEGISIRHLQDDEPIKQAFRYIFTLIGLKAENIPSELQKVVLLNYVKSELGNFTPEEICLAFRLAVSKRLDVEVQHYQNFNAIYLSEVMESFRIQKQNAVSEYKRQLKSLEMEKENEVSPETKLRLFWEFVDQVIVEIWDQFQKTGRINFSHYRIATIFDTLENQLCLLILTKDQKIEIKKRAEEIAKRELDEPSDSIEKIREIRSIKETINAGINHVGFEAKVVNKCKEIAIREFFQKLKNEKKDLRIIIEEMKPKFKFT